MLNGIFSVLRSGAPWRDLPERYGPRTLCDALTAGQAQDGQIADTLLDRLGASYYRTG